LDAHDKGAVLIACGLPTKLRGLLQLMLFTLAPIGGAEFTITVAGIAAAAGVSDRTAGRYLRRLEALGFIVITNNGAIGRRGCPPQQRPNSYRMLTNAERAARRAEVAAEVELLVCQIDRLDSPEERKITASHTGGSTAREARAKWLPELPGGQEGSLPTNTHPAECVEILAAPEPIGADPAPIGSRLLLKNAQVNETRISAPSVNSGVPSDKIGFGTEAAESQAPRQPDQIDRPHRRDGECQQQRPDLRPEGEKMRWNHPVCDPCSMPLRATHVLIRGAPASRVQFCGWCANRCDSGLTVRCDPAGVPYPDNPADARCYVARFRSVALAGAVTMAGPRGPIRLDRMSDSEAVYAAGQCRLIARNVGRIARQRAAATPYTRRLGLA
jgi:hypothetical protein